MCEWVCMNVCMCVYAHVCGGVSIPDTPWYLVYTYVCIPRGTLYIHMCGWVCMNVCMCIYAHVWGVMYVCMCLYVCMCVYVYISWYLVYICMVGMYVCMCMYVHVYVCVLCTFACVLCTAVYAIEINVF